MGLTNVYDPRYSRSNSDTLTVYKTCIDLFISNVHTRHVWTSRITFCLAYVTCGVLVLVFYFPSQWNNIRILPAHLPRRHWPHTG
jgi:hypothetical protein